MVFDSTVEDLFLSVQVVEWPLQGQDELLALCYSLCRLKAEFAACLFPAVSVLKLLHMFSKVEVEKSKNVQNSLTAGKKRRLTP